MRDRRYSIEREWTGSEKTQWVVRFCGDWVGARPTKSSAKGLQHQHDMFRRQPIDAALAAAQADLAAVQAAA